MTRYNTFRYGAKKYNAAETNTNLLWAVEIDWDGDGEFEGTNEAPYVSALTVRRGRESLLSESGEKFNPMGIGQLSLTLDNSSDRYNPYNVSGPLYGKILPGRLIRVSVTNGYGGTRYPVFAGRLANLKPNYKEKTVSLTAEDGGRWLSDRPAQVLVQSAIAVDDAIDAILNSVNWPSAWGRSLDGSPEYITWWWVDPDKSAWNSIQELADFTFATVFVAADGKFTFLDNRHHTIAPILTLDEDTLNKQIVIPQPWEAVRNQVDVVTNPIQQASIAPLWSISDPIYLAAGASVSTWISFRYDGQDVAAYPVLTPVPTTDYRLTKNSDGTGTDLTSYCSVVLTTFSRTAQVTVRNSSASPAYVSTLQVRGQPLVPGEPLLARYEDVTSQGTYGLRRFEIDTPWQQHRNYADMLLNGIRTFFSSPLLLPSVSLEAYPATQFAVDLASRVTLNAPTLGVSSTNFAVGYLEHTWISENGQATRTTIGLEPYIVYPSSYWRFPTTFNASNIFAP